MFFQIRMKEPGFAAHLASTENFNLSVWNCIRYILRSFAMSQSEVHQESYTVEDVHTMSNHVSFIRCSFIQYLDGPTNSRLGYRLNGECALNLMLCFGNG